MWVEGWYQGRYGKLYVIIYSSHILHLLFLSIDFYIAEKIFELINCENKSLRELLLFRAYMSIYKERWCIKICIKSYVNQIHTFQNIGIKFK
jgi:hypothetical protein